MEAEGRALQGVWFEDNGSIVCRWWWNADRRELEVRRGSRTQHRAVSLDAEILADRELLQERLKARALELAQEMG